MNRLFLTISAIGLISVEACAGSPTEPRHFPAPSAVNHDAVGDACTTSDGRSGFLVSAGYGDQLVCQA